MSLPDQECFTEGNEEISKRVPQQMEEVIKLSTSINRLLEDCSMQWKSTVSKKQWRVVNCGTPRNLSWQKSVVARTYFENKDLDEAFQTLLTSKTMFTEHLSYFMALLNGEVIPRSEFHVENQEAIAVNINEPRINEDVSPDVSIIDDRINLNIKSQEALVNIQRTFSDLMKAKMFFDKMFISLNNIVSTGAESPTINSSNCVCQICSNVLETAPEKNFLNIASKLRRSKRINVKRLTSNKRQTIRKGKNVKSTNKKDYSAGDQNQSGVL